MANKQNDIERIGEYIDNELSAIENAYILRAISNNPELASLEKKLRRQKEVTKNLFLSNSLKD